MMKWIFFRKFLFSVCRGIQILAGFLQFWPDHSRTRGLLQFCSRCRKLNITRIKYQGIYIFIIHAPKTIKKQDYTYTVLFSHHTLFIAEEFQNVKTLYTRIINLLKTGMVYY